MTVRPGRPPVISVEQVLAVSIECADSEGIAGCTMRAVAERLGVTPMALYRHVPNKDGLLALMPDALLAEVAAGVARHESSIAALREIALGLAAVLQAHPWAAPLFEQPQRGPNMQSAAEHCVQRLLAEGASTSTAFRMIRSVVAQVIGESLTAHGRFDPMGVELLLTAIEGTLHHQTHRVADEVGSLTSAERVEQLGQDRL